MGYRPDDQSLEQPIRDMLDAMKRFDDARVARLRSGEWNREHVQELTEAYRLMVSLEERLYALLQGTW